MRSLTAHHLTDSRNARRAWVRRWVLAAACLLALGGLAAAWRFSPLAALARPERAAEWAAEFASRPWAPFAVIAAYTPASIVLFPRPVITLLAVVAFGAWTGFACALTGILLAALLTYAIGRRLDDASVRRIAGARLERLRAFMRRRGVLAMTAVRLVPLAPFAVVNIVAGGIRIRASHFAVGTLLGILPGTLVATVFGDQLATALYNPRALNPMLLVTAAALLAAATWAVRRWLFSSRIDDVDDTPPQG